MDRTRGRTFVILSLVFLSRAAQAQVQPQDDAASPEPGVKPVAAYAKTTRDSVAIAGRDVWYLEEFDARERPSSAVRWEKGEITERTTWFYHDNSDVVRLSVRTGADGSTESEFDESGRCVGMVVVDVSGSETRYRYAYDSQGRLSESWTEDGKKSVRVTYAYRPDGSLSERKVFTDGSITLVASYRDDDNWVETAYFGGVPILVVEYVNGVRRKGNRE